MTEPPRAALCPEETLQKLADAIGGGDDAAGPGQVADLLARYPGDARLHFLHGSLLAGRGQLLEARQGLRQAVALAPDYAIARFQLGLLLLTAGETEAAQEAWAPLHALAADNHLRLFAQGLMHLIAGRAREAVRVLRRGIALNAESPALNTDIGLVIDETAAQARPRPGPKPVPSATQILLQRAASKATKH